MDPGLLPATKRPYRALILSSMTVVCVSLCIASDDTNKVVITKAEQGHVRSVKVSLLQMPSRSRAIKEFEASVSGAERIVKALSRGKPIPSKNYEAGGLVIINEANGDRIEIDLFLRTVDGEPRIAFRRADKPADYYMGGDAREFERIVREAIPSKSHVGKE